MKRGGGRRYYRPDDIDLLRGIRHLLYGQGYTIRGVQRILKEQGLRYVQSLGRGEAVAPAPGPTEREIEETTVPDLAPEGGFSEAPASDELFPELATSGEVRRRPAQPPQAVLPTDLVMRLNGALGELMECRRLLAVARGVGVSEPDRG